MKKKTLLSLLTGIAIVASTAGTYAVWDTTQASSSGTVTFRNPVTVSANETYQLNTSASTLGATPSASGNVTFTVANGSDLANTLTIKPEVTGTDVSNISASDFNITLTKKGPSGNSTTQVSGNASSGFVDNSINPSGTNTYTVTITPNISNSGTTPSKNDSKIINAIKDKQLNVKLTATLSYTATSTGSGQ